MFCAGIEPNFTRVLFGVAVGLSIGTAVYLAARKQLLTFRYMVGWLILCSLGVAAGLFARLLGPIADWLDVSPAAVLAAIALVLLVLISIQLSISISGLQRRNQDLSEEIAFLRFEVEQLQRRTADDAET